MSSMTEVAEEGRAQHEAWQHEQTLTACERIRLARERAEDEAAEQADRDREALASERARRAAALHAQRQRAAIRASVERG